MSRSEFAVRATIVVLLFAGGGLLAFLLWWARDIVLMTFAGVLFAIFLNTPSDWLRRHTPLPYWWALGIVVLLLLGLLGLAGWLLGSSVTAQVSELLQTLPNSLNELRRDVRQYEGGKWLLARANSGDGLLAPDNAWSSLTGFASSVFTFLVGVVVIVFIGLYCAAEPHFHTTGLLHLVPIRRRCRAAEVIAVLGITLKRWLMVRLASMTVVGLMVALGLWLIGIPVPLALGLLAFMLEMIPNLGPVLAAVPALLVAVTRDTNTILYVAGLYFLVQTLESYVIIPLLERNTVRLPPLLSITSVVLFGWMGGLLGALVAAPLILTLMVLVQMLYVEDVLGDQSIHGVGGTTTD